MYLLSAFHNLTCIIRISYHRDSCLTRCCEFHLLFHCDTGDSMLPVFFCRRFLASRTYDKRVSRQGPIGFKAIVAIYLPTGMLPCLRGFRCMESAGQADWNIRLLSNPNHDPRLQSSQQSSRSGMGFVLSSFLKSAHDGDLESFNTTKCQQSSPHRPFRSNYRVVFIFFVPITNVIMNIYTS